MLKLGARSCSRRGRGPSRVRVGDLASVASAISLDELMAPGLGARLRHLLYLIHADLDPEAQQYPEIAAAVCRLENVVQEFLPAGPARRARGHQKWLVSQKVVRLKNQLKWARKGRRQAELELQRFTQGKQSSKQNRMTPEFLAKVALSSPVPCARSLLAAWRDLLGWGSLAAAGPPSLPFAMPLRKS